MSTHNDYKWEQCQYSNSKVGHVVTRALLIDDSIASCGLAAIIKNLSSGKRLHVRHGIRVAFFEGPYCRAIH